ncbi:molybdopterin-guanine dinucleotide biosynthesis protein B [Halomonas sp. IOP_31]|uniref:molybdopterin-guanine dinucleotide biosynthesis protein B n=1 Tax=Halomonas sp. IOP_31 TaxID=2876584 RepID=UPI001E54A6EB|nr:molybdopterin-guanine dinucleotide biosynthesis protein B [Halomonas sp. IOP_31]MCD6008936.1 molybdopterin-guanine dinucleotide biosynthesis protein B [Halomonas sp. IOP_31]
MKLDLDRQPVPLLGIAAWSGVGKTTLLEALLPRLRQAGLRVAVIKHAHHRFDIDRPGKDSYRLRQAGATPMLVASRERFALMMETPCNETPCNETPCNETPCNETPCNETPCNETPGEEVQASPEDDGPDLAALLAHVQLMRPDLILIEGFKNWPLPKLELHRPSLGKPLLAGDDPWVQAVASDDLLKLPAGVAALDLNDLTTLTAFVSAWPATWSARRDPRRADDSP